MFMLLTDTPLESPISFGVLRGCVSAA